MIDRDVRFVQAKDGPKAFVWVHVDELAALRRWGSTTRQLRDAIAVGLQAPAGEADAHLNTHLEYLTGHSVGSLSPRRLRRYAVRWPGELP